MSSDKPASPPVSTWLSPEGVVVLAAAGATAAAVSMPLVIVPGVLAYGILTFLRYGRWRDGEGDRAFKAEAPDVAGLDAGYAAIVLRCADLEQRVLDAIKSADPGQRAMLAGSIDRVRGLARTAASLARKLQELDRNLGATDPRELDSEAKTLARRVASATDSLAKQGYERAQEQQRQKVEVVGELRARRDRIDAQLTNIELSLQTVSAQILRIKSTGAEIATAEGARVAEALDALSIDVDAVAETVDESAEAFGPPGSRRVR